MIVLALLGFLLLALRARRRADALVPAGGRLPAVLDSRAIVVIVGVVTGATMWWCWGSVHPLATVHDEIAYLLQARIFASGHWTAPSPPLTRFFEQAYVIVDPAVASKYPPGFSLLLAIGVLLGVPALVPMLLMAASGALVFVLARCIANGGVALLTWILWLSSPSVLLFGPRFYSECVTTACWLAGWLLLLRWRDDGRLRWLLALAVVIGWGAITRPLTMFLYAIPVGVAVLVLTVRRRSWRDLVLAAALGTAVLGVIPLWSARTTGEWRTTPLALYTRQYAPWDLPGFGFNETPPQRPLPPDIARLRVLLGSVHAAHTLEALPSIFMLRMEAIADAVWGGPRKLLLPFALVGLATLGWEGGLALACAVALILGYLSFAMYAGWTLYYYESFPVFAYLTASGMARVLAAITRRSWSDSGGDGWRVATLSPALAWSALLFIPATVVVARVVRRLEAEQHAPQRAFADRLAALEGQRAVVFVRYMPSHDAHVSFVRNSSELARDHIWVVYDRGAVEDRALLERANGRAPWLYDEATGTLERLDVVR